MTERFPSAHVVEFHPVAMEVSSSNDGPPPVLVL
jgi:hypothetical protein